MVNSFGSFFMVCHQSSCCLWFPPFLPYDNFKKLLPLWSSGPTNITTMKRQAYIVSSNLCLFTCPQATGFPCNPYPQRYISAKKVFLKCIPLFLVLTFQIIYKYPTCESIQRNLNMRQLLRFLNY